MVFVHCLFTSRELGFFLHRIGLHYLFHVLGYFLEFGYVFTVFLVVAFYVGDGNSYFGFDYFFLGFYLILFAYFLIFFYDGAVNFIELLRGGGGGASTF